MTAQFLLTLPPTAPAELLADIEQRLRFHESTRLQPNVFLFRYDMELADGILGRAKELNVAWTLHIVGGDLVPIKGRMQRHPVGKK